MRRMPAQIMHDWQSLVECAEMVAQTGVKVTVIQACCVSEVIVHNDIAFHFVKPDGAQQRVVTGQEFVRCIRALAADVFHVHGLMFNQDARQLRAQFPQVPILLQDHADGLPRFWRRGRMRRAMAAVDGVAFCALEQAAPFIASRIIHRRTIALEIPECSSRFSPGDKTEARRLTGLHGNPALLWIGHLNENKDPLTVLDAVAASLPDFPDLQFWCCYGTSPLLAEMQRRLAGNAGLAARVHLLGKVPHERVEILLRAADLFVSASHREGSGVSLIEAMACGLPPVVTDIPSFNVLTGQGMIGALWDCGRADSLSQALSSVAARLGCDETARTRAHFDAELSFAAVGRKLGQAYRTLLSNRVG